MSVITRANQAFRDHQQVWEALGMLEKDVSSRKELLDRLSSPTLEGQKQRKALQEGITNTSHEFHGLGIEMNQRYSGFGIFTSDEPNPYVQPERTLKDEVLYHEPSTYPGCRLPHVWLNKAIPTKPVSTIDLAGHGSFALFTGIGGDNWKVAAKKVAADLGVPLTVHSIGFRQDWEDVYFDWARLRGVEESGAVLVRPDRFVAWRAFEIPVDTDACEQKLAKVMKAILGYESSGDK